MSTKSDTKDAVVLIQTPLSYLTSSTLLIISNPIIFWSKSHQIDWLIVNGTIFLSWSEP